MRNHGQNNFFSEEKQTSQRGPGSLLVTRGPRRLGGPGSLLVTRGPRRPGGPGSLLVFEVAPLRLTRSSISGTTARVKILLWREADFPEEVQDPSWLLVAPEDLEVQDSAW